MSGPHFVPLSYVMKRHFQNSQPPTKWPVLFWLFSFFKPVKKDENAKNTLRDGQCVLTSAHLLLLYLSMRYFLLLYPYFYIRYMHLISLSPTFMSQVRFVLNLIYFLFYGLIKTILKHFTRHAQKYFYVQILRFYQTQTFRFWTMKIHQKIYIIFLNDESLYKECDNHKACQQENENDYQWLHNCVISVTTNNSAIFPL